MRKRTWVVVLAFGLAFQGVAQQAKTDAEVADESKRADELLHQMKFAEALPLAEELHALRPTNNYYREHLASALFGVAGGMLDKPEEAYKLRVRARQLLLDARKAGDNSDYIQIMLEKTENDAPSNPQTFTPERQALNEAEKLFASGKLEEAIVQYKKISDDYPKYYEPRLYAGDAFYKLNRYDEAGEWYAKAIIVDPDRETAYRYWGDALFNSGKQDAAGSKYIDAVVAEPYTKTPWVQLEQWAKQMKVPVYSPQIKLPQGPTQDPKKPGNTNITIDPAILGGNEKDSGGAAWISYPMSRALWMNEKFKKIFPNEKQYRHSLAEEVDALSTVLTVAKELKVPEAKLDNNLRQLLALQRDGMLECWILLNNADQGIAQDYPAYREKHRDTLHAYVAKYVLHPGEKK